MLNYLAVKNVSVIESVSLELSKGLTVMTGETGSGKSVLLGALKLLLGERFQKNMLRDGAAKLMVEGIFNNIHNLPQDLIEQFDVEDELIIRREVDDAGKNKIFINGRAATVAQLKEFAPHLADIHGQHEHQTLMDDSKHIILIDHLVPADIKKTYQGAYSQYKTKKDEYDELISQIDDVRKYQEIINFQYNEINAADINLNEDNTLDERISFLSHIEKIREGCGVAMEALTEGEINATELVSKSAKALEPLTSYVPELKGYHESLNGCLDAFNDAIKFINGLYDKQEASPEELDRLIQRRYMLAELVKKYSNDRTLESLLKKEDELKSKIENFENSDEILARLKNEMEGLYKNAFTESEKLLKVREEVALKIAEQVMTILGELEFSNSNFFTKFTRKEQLDSKGGVQCEFYLSVNAGFAPAPLAQVASGGEISRVMLALKEVFGNSDGVETMLFDEIDTGISGITAKKVAQKLKKLGQTKQIIVITHLPVVAAVGNEHFYISKKVEDNKTKTSILKLSDKDRLNAIASMIAGNITPSSLQQAEELMKQ